MPTLHELSYTIAQDILAEHECDGKVVQGLLDRYAGSFEDILEDDAASWDASREPEWPAWAALPLEMQASYIGFELAGCVLSILHLIEYNEDKIHESMPDARDVVAELNIKLID